MEDLGLAHEVIVAMKEGQCLPKYKLIIPLSKVTPYRAKDLWALGRQNKDSRTQNLINIL